MLNNNSRKNINKNKVIFMGSGGKLKFGYKQFRVAKTKFSGSLIQSG